MSAARIQTVWLAIPSGRGLRHIRVNLITEVIAEDGATWQETTTAVDAGEVLEAVQSGKPVLTFTKPTL